MGKIIGLIVEAISDKEVIHELAHKIAPQRRFRMLAFRADGSGKIQGKCKQWANDLRRRGCTSLIIVQDLDNNCAADLALALKRCLEPSPIPRYTIVIPVQMIEAWLLSDPIAVQKAFNLSTVPSIVGNPESIVNPKARLGEIVHCTSGRTKAYLHTVHNKRIAAAASLEKLRTCTSFRPLETFINSVFT